MPTTAARERLRSSAEAGMEAPRIIVYRGGSPANLAMSAAIAQGRLRRLHASVEHKLKVVPGPIGWARNLNGGGERDFGPREPSPRGSLTLLLNVSIALRLAPERIMRAMAGIAYVIALAACAPPAATSDGAGASGVVLTADRAQYRAGDALVLTLRNGLSQPIGYNLCGAALERRVGTEWREAPQRLAEVCTMELRTLAPGASDTYRHTVPAGVTAGEYRVRSAVESPLGGSWAGVTTAPFTITG